MATTCKQLRNIMIGSFHAYQNLFLCPCSLTDTRVFPKRKVKKKRRKEICENGERLDLWQALHEKCEVSLALEHGLVLEGLVYSHHSCGLQLPVQYLTSRHDPTGCYEYLHISSSPSLSKQTYLCHCLVLLLQCFISGK